jgi:hypothetical protein
MEVAVEARQGGSVPDSQSGEMSVGRETARHAGPFDELAQQLRMSTGRVDDLGVGAL